MRRAWVGPSAWYRRGRHGSRAVEKVAKDAIVGPDERLYAVSNGPTHESMSYAALLTMVFLLGAGGLERIKDNTAATIGYFQQQGEKTFVNDRCQQTLGYVTDKGYVHRHRDKESAVAPAVHALGEPEELRESAGVEVAWPRTTGGTASTSCRRCLGRDYPVTKDLRPPFLAEPLEHGGQHRRSCTEAAHDQGYPSEPGSIAEPGGEV